MRSVEGTVNTIVAALTESFGMKPGQAWVGVANSGSLMAVWQRETGLVL